MILSQQQKLKALMVGKQQDKRKDISKNHGKRDELIDFQNFSNGQIFLSCNEGKYSLIEKNEIPQGFSRLIVCNF